MWNLQDYLLVLENNPVDHSLVGPVSAQSHPTVFIKLYFLVQVVDLTQLSKYGGPLLIGVVIEELSGSSFILAVYIHGRKLMKLNLSNAHISCYWNEYNVTSCLYFV